MKIYPNEPCPCGSGKKYKKCCMNMNKNIMPNTIVDGFNKQSSLFVLHDVLYKTGHTNKGDIAWLVKPLIVLEDCQESKFLPKKFIDENYFADYHLVFADYKQKELIYINTPVSELGDNITNITNIISCAEHTWVESVALDSVQHLYFIGIAINRGCFEPYFQYSLKDNDLEKTDMPVPDISFVDLYPDDAVKDIRKPVIDFDNIEINSLHNYDLSDMLSMTGKGQIDNEIKMTEFLISKIENLYNTQLIGERSNLSRARFEMRYVPVFKCVKFFNTWRKSLIDRYSGKICTAELTNNYYGMGQCMSNLPIFVLPDITKLSTFYESVFQQFPVKEDMHYVIPFDNFVIKVSDQDNKSMYVVVHKRSDHYELVGLTNTSNMESNANLDFVALYPNEFILTQYRGGLLSMDICENDEYSAPCIKVPFKYLDKIPTPISGYNMSAYEFWSGIAIEYTIGTEVIKNHLKMPCTDVLILHIWLHALALYNVLVNTQQIEYIKGCSKRIEQIKPAEIKNISNKCIIDLGKTKRVYIYDNDDEKSKICRKYHILSTLRRGFFRHYDDGKIIYITPTEVKYSNKHLAPDAHEKEYSSVYRNSEDFLREKSYLETDVHNMLDSHGINHKREVSSSVFPWIGKKRLDFYLPDKQIAIECQGVQHFYPYGKNDTDFDQRKQRDEDKYNECLAHKIQLLYYVSPLIPIPKDMSNKYLYITDLNDLYALIR